MSIILSTLRDLARTLGCGDHQVETAVREERAARAALSRRGLFKAAGAVAAGVCMPLPPMPSGVAEYEVILPQLLRQNIVEGWGAAVARSLSVNVNWIIVDTESAS